MLHQLRNGNWIDLTDARSIATDISPCPLVRVWAAARLVPEIVRFGSLREAEAYRDELAGLANAARSEAMRVPPIKATPRGFEPFGVITGGVPARDEPIQTWRDRAKEDPTFTRP